VNCKHSSSEELKSHLCKVSEGWLLDWCEFSTTALLEEPISEYEQNGQLTFPGHNHCITLPLQKPISSKVLF